MSNKEYFYRKRCACCNLSFSKSKKNEVHEVSLQSLLEKINAAKRTILLKNNKPYDGNVVESGDLVCQNCITTSNRFKTPSTSARRQSKGRQLTVNPLFREYSEASTSRQSTSRQSTSRGSSSSEESTSEDDQEVVIDKILVDIPRTNATHKNCVVCSRSTNCVVPQEAYFDAFIKRNILIPRGCRCCQEHLNSDKTLKNVSLNSLTAISDNTKLSGYEVKMLIDNLRHSAEMGIFGKFEKSSNFTEEECVRYTGLTKEQFKSLTKDMVSLKKSPERSKEQALATYLFWMKTGLDFRTTASVFSLNHFQKVGHYCKQVRKALTKDFVPKYIGAAHLPREEWIKHNTDIVKELFTLNNQQFAIIADGTYCYCQKSSNNYFQRKSFSMQKKRHLVKPFVICSTDGLIVDIYGPYPATENDATIIQKVLDSDKDLKRLLKARDHLILDRGFRDAVEKLKKEYRFKTHMPTCLPPNQKQLTTLQANQSRFVTKCRWPVEAVNGLLKTLFRSHDKVVTNVSVSYALADFRIAGALINRFHKRLLSDVDDGKEIAREMKRKLHSVNKLENIIDTNRLDRQSVPFKKLDANTITDFPRIDRVTLKKKITLGTYQLKQSLSYLAEHQLENGNFTIEVFSDKKRILDSKSRLLRARFQSRHSGATKYKSYITYMPNGNSRKSITGWLCSCKIGLRTVGCCSHIASIIYQLSYGKYNESNNPAASLQSIFPVAAVVESSDEDDVSSEEDEIFSDETEIRSDATENRDETNEILSDATEVLSDISLESDREQYVSIYPDLSNLMESP